MRHCELTPRASPRPGSPAEPWAMACRGPGMPPLDTLPPRFETPPLSRHYHAPLGAARSERRASTLPRSGPVGVISLVIRNDTVAATPTERKGRNNNKRAVKKEEADFERFEHPALQ